MIYKGKLSSSLKNQTGIVRPDWNFADSKIPTQFQSDWNRSGILEFHYPVKR